MKSRYVVLPEGKLKAVGVARRKVRLVNEPKESWKHFIEGRTMFVLAEGKLLVI